MSVTIYDFRLCFMGPLITVFARDVRNLQSFKKKDRERGILACETKSLRGL